MKPEAAAIHDLVSLGPASAFAGELETSEDGCELHILGTEACHREPLGPDSLLGSQRLLGPVCIT